MLAPYDGLALITSSKPDSSLYFDIVWPKAQQTVMDSSHLLLLTEVTNTTLRSDSLLRAET